jgi:hypothetical protein
MKRRLNLPFADIWLAVAVLLMVAGCVAGQQGSSQELVLKTSVQYGTMKYLGSHPNHIEKAEFLVDEVAAALESEQSATLALLETIVVDSIPWEKMTPEERLILTALLTEIKYQVGLKIGEGVLGESERVWGMQFLSWVRQAIQMSKV